MINHFAKPVHDNQYSALQSSNTVAVCLLGFAHRLTNPFTTGPVRHLSMQQLKTDAVVPIDVVSMSVPSLQHKHHHSRENYMHDTFVKYTQGSSSRSNQAWRA